MRVLKIVAIAALGLVLMLACAVGLFFATAGVDTPEGQASREVLARGPHQVKKLDTTFVDRNRPTLANNDFAGSDERRLVTSISYPTNANARGVAREGRPANGFPLIVYSHGFMSRRSEGAYLARHFARHGYFFVAADYPLTNFASPGGPRFDDVAHQPGDVRFLIDRLLRWNDDSNHEFFGTIDPERIGVMGLSLGGMTSTLAAFHPELRDDRIGAAVSIAGPSAMFTPAFFETAEVPFLMIAGDADAIVPYPENAASLPERAPRSGLVTLKDGSHVGFADIARYTSRWSRHGDTLACGALMGAVTEDADLGDVPGLGGLDQGVARDQGGRLCDPLPSVRSMRPARQQMLTTLAAFSFFESRFAAEAAERKRAADYLATELSGENEDVTVRLPSGHDPASRTVAISTSPPRPAEHRLPSAPRHSGSPARLR
ncbi:MAG: hypothetical protein F4Y16_05985 [Holophagales bacterium]|nr:hypothetical protein [Holophagales bacterium]